MILALDDVPALLDALLTQATVPGPPLQPPAHSDAHPTITYWEADYPNDGPELPAAIGRRIAAMDTYRFVGCSDATAWDWHGHLHVNGRQACCHTWWRRLLIQLLRRHV